MYHDHFGLLEAPFSIAPDPRYLYMSERHREALAHLLYGMDSDGAFILLTGDVGTGKTTVSRCLLEQVPDNTNLAMVLNPKLSSLELLQVICDELGIQYDNVELSVKTLVDNINCYLLEAHAEGKKTVVLIEEAQNLDLDVLEQLRLLTNLETNERKLLQVILLGQPEFLDVLDRHELSQLAQRITARFHLTPLKLGEVEEYISHRLAIAGCRRPLFANGVTKLLYKYSGGVPRLINVICDRALLGTYVQNRHHIDKKTLISAAKEVLGENKAASINSAKFSPLWFKRSALAVVIIPLLAAVIYFSPFQLQHPSIVTPQKETESTGDSSYQAPARESNNAVEPVKENGDTAGVSYIEWPENNQRLRSNLQAYQGLFNRWQLNYDQTTDGTPCFYAQTQGLSCLHEASDLKSLRELNRPAVLKLYDDFNQPQYITLIELGVNSASILMADKQSVVSLKQLMFYWKGEFSMLWRFPPGYKSPIKPGSGGETVVWLSQVMNEIDKDPEKAIRSIYDAELVDRVKQFQLLRGLRSDGVVGEKTLIHLNQVMTMQAPQLEKNS